MKNLFRFYARVQSKPLLKDATLINKLYRKHRLSIMLAITVGYGFAYTCRLAISIVKKPLIDGNIFTASELGAIGSAFFYCYALGKFSNGFLADHVNVKKFLATGVLFSSLINIAMGGSTILTLWLFLWGMNGLFQAVGAPSSAVSLSAWFSSNERGRMYGIWSTGHAIGEGLTFFGVAALVSWLGWQAGFLVPGIICSFIALGIYLLMQDRPDSLGLPSIAEWKKEKTVAPGTDDFKNQSTLKAQLSVLKFPSIWILGLSSALMYVTRYAVNSWGILYLQEAKGYSLAEAGGIIGVNTLAGIAGCVAYGFISDKLFSAKRPPVTLIFGVIEVLSLFVIFFGPKDNMTVLTIAFIVYGFTLSGLLAALGGLFAIDIAPQKAAGAAMGVVGIFSYIGAALQDQVSGFLIDKGMTMVDGVRHYDFSQVVLLWIGASVASMLLAATLWRVEVRD